MVGTAENRVSLPSRPSKACSASKDRNSELASELCGEDAEDVSRRGSIVKDVSEEGGVKGARLGSPDAGRYASSGKDISDEGVVKVRSKSEKSKGKSSRSASASNVET